MFVTRFLARLPAWVRRLLALASAATGAFSEWAILSSPVLPKHWADLKRFSELHDDVGGTIAVIWVGIVLVALYVLPLGYLAAAWYLWPPKVRKTEVLPPSGESADMRRIGKPEPSSEFRI